MRVFEKKIAGYLVTNENYQEVAKEIARKHGVCPAINEIVMTIVAADETAQENPRGLTKAINKAISMIGYSPAYFNAKMREIGPDDGDEWHPGE